jgi:protein-glutamine gamma-glutamyltransferase
VVTGYHGGERNPVDGFWTVRQSDAHAWAEVWLAGQGWTRIDPTAYVAPARTTDLARLRPPPGLFEGTLVRLNPTLLAQMRALWEATNNRWNQWVLNYTQSRQLDLLKRLGFQSPSWTDLVHVLVGALVAVSLAGAAWMWWGRSRRDPWLRLLDRTRHRLVRLGVPLPVQATPRQMAAALARHPHAPGAAMPVQAWTDWLLALERQRYDPQHSTPLRELAASLRRLPSL